MSLSKDIMQYPVEKSIWERALVSGGVTLNVPKETVTRLRMRLYQYRCLVRDQSKLLVPPNDPDYGKSAYDRFLVTVNKQGDVVIKLDPIYTIILPED